ncbi:MAG: antibiotic biosynthesis monooxygenase, partial [Saprospiraceae bacterium]|nr:antibiotic biosynthesis monooxygenase [Saprospiraceae bacterium]
ASKSEYFYSTAILKIKEVEKVSFALEELKILRQYTLLEAGNVSFELKQSKEDPTVIVIWECFKNETSFQEHLQSAHLATFLKTNLVTLQNGYQTVNIY